MILEPLYAENIIVAVIYNSKFKWYVTDRELWFLDYTKMDAAYEKLGISVNEEYEPDERKGIKILNQDNVNIFLQKINKYEVTKYDLNYYLYKCINNRTEKEEVLSFNPSLLVNFDDKILYSMFPEPASYEAYMPNGWKGKYEVFVELIPKYERYWIDKFNNNMLLS